MIIEYLMTNGAHQSVCCGNFRDWDHFLRFQLVEITYNRKVLWAKVVKV